jgi:peptidoglycan/xylan/chitin deacetylase (PgdA/CDA1 family)
VGQSDGRLAVHWGAILIALAVILAVYSTRTDAVPDFTQDGSGGQAGTARAGTAQDATPVGPVCTKGPPVALTFDDGPSEEHTADLADLLREEQVPATFFMIGRSVDQHRAVARRVARDGHQLHIHTYDHVDLTKQSDEQIRRQIERSEAAFERAGVTHGGVVRPPFGAVNPRVRQALRDMNYSTVLWTVDTHDWSDARSADDIVRSVRQELRPRATILLHDKADSDETMQAVPRIIEIVRRRGYCFGVVDDDGKVVRASFG